MVVRARNRVPRSLDAALTTTAIARAGLACWLCVWAMYLIIGYHPYGEIEAMNAVLGTDESWVGDWGDSVTLDLEPRRFVLRAGDRAIATGNDPAALSPARLSRVVAVRPRVFVAPCDGVDLDRIIDAMDALRAAGFLEIWFDVEHTGVGVADAPAVPLTARRAEAGTRPRGTAAR